MSIPKHIWVSYLVLHSFKGHIILAYGTDGKLCEICVSLYIIYSSVIINHQSEDNMMLTMIY